MIQSPVLIRKFRLNLHKIYKYFDFPCTAVLEVCADFAQSTKLEKDFLLFFAADACLFQIHLHKHQTAADGFCGNSEEVSASELPSADACSLGMCEVWLSFGVGNFQLIASPFELQRVKKFAYVW